MEKVNWLAADFFSHSSRGQKHCFCVKYQFRMNLCLAWLRTRYFCTFRIVTAGALGRREIETKFNTNAHQIHLKHTDTVKKKVIHNMLLLFPRSTITHVDLKQKGRVGCAYLEITTSKKLCLYDVVGVQLCYGESSSRGRKQCFVYNTYFGWTCLAWLRTKYFYTFRIVTDGAWTAWNRKQILHKHTSNSPKTYWDG